ncbi:hypothetical protein [Gordonia crocea]|uniref:Uncharacterized protein n=1 Tax=Gordonia crocea TaxID=589162 RepID=A0A7I9UWP5_9ACTN|nr:hypothetical protein [Gordonia crocea]GED97200.1 hypothetical protein nbrc107697_12390 [Gordonia crocea]
MSRSKPRVKPLPSDAPHEVEFFKRHRDDDKAQTIPGLEALLSFPVKVRARLLATLSAVAKAPPKRFAGGGQWEAMHGEMTGYFEARITSSTPNGKWHYRLFCILDYAAQEKNTPLLVVIDGAAKRYQTTLTNARYGEVRDLGDEYRKRNPRSFATAEDVSAALGTG